MPNASDARAASRQLRDLAHAMISEAQMLKRAGERDLAQALGRRARALDLLSWGYVEPAVVSAR